MEGNEIWLGEEDGPAVIGFLRNEIVIPGWALSLDGPQRRLMLAHEQEHARAGDPQLLLLGLATVVLLPWNPATWWQLHRLRGAIEVDCDRRVLGEGKELRNYGQLLLEVGRRGSGLRLPAAVTTGGGSQLERRVRVMTRISTRFRRSATVAGSMVAVALLVIACELQPPVGPGTPSTAVAPGAGPDPSVDLGVAPVFTPYEVRPTLLDRQAFAAALADAYPATLRDAGIGGTAIHWAFITSEGRVGSTRLVESSGHADLDAATEAVLRTARFTPARNNSGDAVPVWVQLPVTMRAVDESTAEAAPTVPSRPTEVGADAWPGPLVPATLPREPVRAPVIPAPLLGTGSDDIGARPTFTPYESRPILRNPAEFAGAMEVRYPQGLKSAGIGGRVVLWVFIDERGAVGDVRLVTSSGHEAMDRAAESILCEVAVFAPARNRDADVAVWVQLPITFS